MRFSVIVPVYNVENYIRKCLQSILNQTYTDYEIIVVNDETPDNSMAIVESIAAEYPDKINIIHQKNKGLGGARNTGAEAAKGEYIVFIDSDDYIENNMLSQLDAYIGENTFDIVMFNYSEVFPSGEVIAKRTFFTQNKICSQTEEKGKLLLTPPSAWNKIFRRVFFIESGVTFPEKTLYEDVVTRILTAKADKILLCIDYFYNYVQRQGSIMNSEVSPRVIDIIKVTDLVCEGFVKNGLMENYKLFIETAQTHSLFTIAESIYEKSPNNILKDKITDYIKTKFLNCCDSPYLSNTLKKQIYFFINDKMTQYKWYKRKEKMMVGLYNNPVLQSVNKLCKKIGL